MVSKYRPLIEQFCAHKPKLDPKIVEAVVFTESSDETYAWNPEPRFKYFWNVRANTPFRVVSTAEVASKVPPADFPSYAGDRDQEWWGQQASWGLMQLMGAVAREHGYLGRYLPGLTDPTINLMLGVKYLDRLRSLAQDDISTALARYNGGNFGNPVGGPWRNGEYVAKVLARVKQLT